jgi:hypothetical protein
MWDGPGQRMAMQPLYDAVESMGVAIARPPGFDDSSRDKLAYVFETAGLENVDTTAIDIELTFDDFNSYWASQTRLASHPIVQSVHAMTAKEVDQLKARLRDRLAPAPDGHVGYWARANAVKGQAPG